MKELQVPNYNHMWIKRTMNWARKHLFSLISILSIFHSLSFFFPNCISKISSSLQLIFLINIDHHDLYHHLESFLSIISTNINPAHDPHQLMIYRPPILDLLVILIILFLFLSFRLPDQYWKHSNNYNIDMKKPPLSAAAAAAAAGGGGGGEYDIEINYHGISGRKVELASSSYLLDYKYCFPNYYYDTNTAATTTTTTSSYLFAVSDHDPHESHNFRITNELSQKELYDGNPVEEECFEFGGDHQAAAEKIIGEDMIIGRSRRRETSSTTHVFNTQQQQQLWFMLSEDLAIIPAASADYIDQDTKSSNAGPSSSLINSSSSSSSSYTDKMVMLTADDATAARKKKSSRKQLPRSRITTSVDSASTSSSSSYIDHDHHQAAAAAASKTINSGSTTDHDELYCGAGGGLICTTDHQYCPVNIVPSNSVVYLNRQPKLSDVLAASTPTLRNCSNNYDYNYNYEDIFMLEEEQEELDENHDQYSYCTGSTSCCRVVDVDQVEAEEEDSSTDHDQKEMISMEQTWWMITGSAGNSNSTTAVGRHDLITKSSSAHTELPIRPGKKNIKMQIKGGGGAAGRPATTAPVISKAVLETSTNYFKDHEAVSRSVPALVISREKSMGLEELHKRAEAFISKMREDIQLQRQESYRFFMDMMNRSVHSS